jgi:hypothetical protein
MMELLLKQPQTCNFTKEVSDRIEKVSLLTERTDFLHDLYTVSAGETLSLIWREFRKEYERVSMFDLDDRYSKFI